MMMTLEQFQELQRYVGWAPEDALRIRSHEASIRSEFRAIIEDFYAEITKHPATVAVMKGGDAQIDRLKTTLLQWLEEMIQARCDNTYLQKRSRVGWRHVEIGLPATFVGAAMSRMQTQLFCKLQANWDGSERELFELAQSLSKLFHLELILVQHAYQLEDLNRGQLQERERGDEVFRNLVEAADCSIVLINESCDVEYVSSYTLESNVDAAIDYQGRSCFGLVFDESSRTEIKYAIDRAFEGSPSRDVRATATDAQGNVRTLLYNFRVLARFRPKPVVIAVGHDITQIIQSQQRALQAERLASIGKMSAGLAHESRNALQRIQAACEMLEYEVEGNQEASEYLTRIQASQEHLRLLLDEVRNYAGPIHLEIEECGVPSLWREAWDLIPHHRETCEEAVLHETIEDDTLVANADRFRMVQLFRNIFENSFSVCGEKCEITVTCESALWKNRPAACITIHDNGPGLSQGQIARVFEPFFTTRPTGTGLGMAIVERTIHAHGGVVSIRNGAQGGACVEIYLPLRQQGISHES